MARHLRWFLATLAVMIAAWDRAASADTITLYTSRSAFDAATTDRSLLDLSGLAPTNGFMFYGNPGNLSVGGVTFASNGPLFVQNDGETSRVTFQQAQPTNVHDVTLPAGTTAFGFDFLSGDPLTITFASGETFDLGAITFPDTKFAGFTSDRAIASFRLESIPGADLSHITLARAVSEPGAAFLLVTGGLSGMGAIRGTRRRPSSGPGGCDKSRSPGDCS